MEFLFTLEKVARSASKIVKRTVKVIFTHVLEYQDRYWEALASVRVQTALGVEGDQGVEQTAPSVPKTLPSTCRAIGELRCAGILPGQLQARQVR